MEPYDAFAAIDAFETASRAFDCLKDDLASPDTDAMTHHQLEGLIATRGRELQRLLFQARLDLRARRERE
ncbi:hypothetical protein ACH4PR_50600 [Streptomyces mirabilis]|uniref:hypothetical protein n=1 Tax=Streptomyces mirabilis TaxID=68239 RepID=UPI0037A4F98B